MNNIPGEVHMMTTPSRPAIFLDRDGTIIEDKGFVADVHDVEFIPGVFDSLRMLQKNYLLFIVTNQSGVGLGKIREEDALNINTYIRLTCASEGVVFTRIYTCMHKRDDRCRCIKPNPFFLYKARDNHMVDLKRSFVIGDHPHDMQFAINGGATGLYVLTGHGLKHKAGVPDGTPVFPSMREAVDFVLPSA